MKKKHIIISILCFFFIFYIAPLGQYKNITVKHNITNEKDCNKKNNSSKKTETNSVIISQDLFFAPKVETIKPPRVHKKTTPKKKNGKKNKSKTTNKKSNKIKVQPKKIKSLYDTYSKEEIDLLFRIVETEVRDNEYFDEKANVCSVIFNRLKHKEFPNTLTGVLTQRYQFSSYAGGNGDYQKVTITDMTIAACEYVYKNGDTTGGALYFDSTSGNSWASKHKTYMFTDGVGHAFYK